MVFPIAPATAPATNKTDASGTRVNNAKGLCVASHAKDGCAVSEELGEAAIEVTTNLKLLQLC